MNKSKYEQEYLPADKYIIVNDNDPDLTPIVLSLPKPPSLHTIDGYGLKPEDQRFERLEIPRKLIDLEKEAIRVTKEELPTVKGSAVTLLKIQKTFWRLFKERHKNLRKEIAFIRRIWWHRIHGYWFFVRGKPTWIPGKFFYYLNFFHMDTKAGHPEYRDADRKYYVFCEYCRTATETFAKLDEHGYAIPKEDGSFLMTDLGRRICFGDARPKNRRCGATTMKCSDGTETITRTLGTDGFGIQSYSEDNAKSHFKTKVFPAWNKLPIWLKPYSNSSRTSDSIKLDTDKNDFVESGLGTQIVYATTASSKFFDGKKMMELLVDEGGKPTSCSVSERHGVNKHTLAQGDGMIIHGYVSQPSTVDQISDSSGDYQFLMASSNFYRRIKSKGQTPSGMFRIFISAQEVLEGFIDSYGYAVTGEVEDYQKEEGFKQTAEDYLFGERELLLKENTPESLRKYREHKQLYPMQYADCWMGMSGDIGFDMEKIDKRIAETRRHNDVVRGNLEWKDGKYGGDVYFVEDAEKGRFMISKMPPEEVSNKMVRVSIYNPFSDKTETSWRPMYPGMFTAGADPFDLSKGRDKKIGESLGKKSSLSDGGIAVLWNYDESLDGEKEKYNWESYRFVLTYRYRQPNTDAFNEDALKACIFFGASMYPETNVINTYEYFMRSGFGGYLLYDIDKYSGRLKDKPGLDSLERSKQDIFALWRDYVDYRIHKEQHPDLLHELKDIQGIEYMRYFDLIAAGGMALMGAKSVYSDLVKRVEDKDYDLSDFNMWG